MVAAGQTIGARAQLTWRVIVPTHTRVSGEWLEWQQGEVHYGYDAKTGYDTMEPYHVKLRSVNGPRCLEDFAALAGKKPAQFRAFATTYGPLLAVNAASKEHVWKTNSVVWPVFDAQELPSVEDDKGLWRQEPLAQWTEWSLYVQFVLKVSEMLRQRAREGQEGIPLDVLRCYGAEPRPPRAHRRFIAGPRTGRFALAENLAHGALPDSGILYPRDAPPSLELQWRILLGQVTQDFLAAPCVRQSFAPALSGTLKASRLSLERDEGETDPERPLPPGVFPLVAASLANALINPDPDHLHVCIDCQQHYFVKRRRANGRCETCRKAERAKNARDKRKEERAS